MGFEPTISAGERLQTYALDRAATGTGSVVELGSLNTTRINHMQCSVRRARNVLFKYSDILEFDILLIVKNYRRLG